MANFLNRVNHLPVFDTERWPERELVSRLCGIAAVSVFLFRKLTQYPAVVRGSTFFHPLLRKLCGETAEPHGFSQGDLWLLIWLVETGIFLCYIVSFLTRERSKAPPKGFMEVVYPFIVAGLPVLISMLPYGFNRVFPPRMEFAGLEFTRGGLLWAVGGLMLAGGMLNLVGLVALRRAFTIMTDARRLITSGPFALVRHPLYTGHFIMFFGVTLLHISPLAVAMYAAFAAGQTLRAKIEERKLESVFPEYADYRKRTGMFFPKLRLFPAEARRSEK